MDNFCHLHIHSECSILDGYSSVIDIPKIAKEMGQTSVAITDHGSLSGIYRFWKAAKECEIKPIIGVEGYITPDISERDSSTPIWHVGLLARNRLGLRNLYALSRLGWTSGFYRKPRMDYSALRRYGEGLTILSGCMAGETARAIQEGEIDKAREALRRYRQIFPLSLFVELQPGNSKELNWALANLAHDLNLPTVVTCDSHYDLAENKSIQELLLVMQQCSGFKASLKENARAFYDVARKERNLIKRLNMLWPERLLSYDKLELHIMSRQEVVAKMNEQGFDGNALADTTLEIAEQCEPIEFKTGITYLPKAFKDCDSNSYFRELIYDGLKRRKLSGEIYTQRIEEELNIIVQKNFADYFLIVYDIVNTARSRGILIGPGRGSVAGSLVAYCLGITALDPLKYDLLFFRFLNPERNEYPDIDLDFQQDRRDEMKQYVKDKYGEAVSISAFTKMDGKSLIRKIGNALCIPLNEINDICKQFENLEQFESNENEKVVQFKNKHPELLGYAKKLQGHISASGMHAAGVIIVDRNIATIAPIESRTDPDNKKQRVEVCAFDMNDSAELGLIKFDFLGLTNLSHIGTCLKLIKQRHNIDIDWENLEPDDAAVLKDLSSGYTVGVFQLESSPMKRLLIEMGVDNFEDIVAANALVRPGAYNTVADDYIKRKHGLQRVDDLHKNVNQYLDRTFQVYIYQEQVMQLAVFLGDFSWPEAWKLIKIIGKKRNVKEFAPYFNKWMENAGKLLGPQKAERVWKDFEKHSNYSFSRNHSVPYSYLSYVTAWLKHHYALEYLYALLKHEKKDTNRMTYLLEARRLGINILSPDINKSEHRMSIEGESLRFGLCDVKGVGATASKELISKRPFTSYSDIVERIEARKCNKKVLAALGAVAAYNGLEGAPDASEPTLNYMEYLSYPISLEYLGALDLDFTDLEDFDEDSQEFVLIRGVIKSTKRTDRYFRLEIEDLTNSTTVFGAMDNDLSSGEVIIALIGDRTMVGYARVDGLKERLASDNTTQFEKYLLSDDVVIGTKIDNPKPFGSLCAAVLPLQLRQVKTKTGKIICFGYFSDGSTVIKTIIFSGPWRQLKNKLYEFEPVGINLSMTDDGSFTLYESSIIDLEELN